MAVEFPTAGNLSGVLLIAQPSLLDPNFRRTIVYLSHHNADDGAFGVVINRPLGRKVGEVTDKQEAASLSDVPIYEGGPVNKEHVMIASVQWQDKNGLLFQTIEDANQMENLTDSQRTSLRAFLGYAGWSKGQLESEIAQRAWLVVRPTPELVQPDLGSEAWRNYIRKLGPIYRLLAEMPDDPSLN